MTLIDLRNKILIDYEQQIEKCKNDLLQKHKDIIDKQSQIDQLEHKLIDKSAEVAELSETLETDQVKTQQREKYAEDNVTKAMNDIKTLQREVKHYTDFISL